MEIYKRTDGRSPYWHYDTTDPTTGKRIRKSTGLTDRKAALRKAFEEEENLGNPQRTETLAAAADAYVARMKADGKTSWPAVEALCNKLLGKIGPGTDGKPRFALVPTTTLPELTKEKVEALRVARSQEGNKPGTIATEMRILRAICRYAQERGVPPSPVMKWNIPKPVEKLRYLSPDEARRVLLRLHPDTPVKAGSKGKLVVPKGKTRIARQDTHDLFLALILTGGRWNEVATLTRSQVDLGRRTVTLYGWKASKERTVPMVAELQEMLARRLSAPGPALVFPGREKAGGSVRSAPTRAIRRAMTEEGCNAPETAGAFGRATTHSLRHTYASWLRQAGLDLDDLMPLLGHSKITTTMIYARVVPETSLSKARDYLEQTRLSASAPHSNTTEPALETTLEAALSDPEAATAWEDLEAVRTILPEREGWEVGADVCDDGSEYVWANGPDQSAWVVCLDGAEFRGTDVHRPGEASVAGRSRVGVAQAIRARTGVALIRLSDLPVVGVAGSAGA